jgi:hypothetical protein
MALTSRSRPDDPSRIAMSLRLRSRS